jgi:hypothetical protein
MVDPRLRDALYVQAVEELRTFLSELGVCHPPVLTPMLHEHFVGQLNEIWSRAATFHNELTPEAELDVTPPPFIPIVRQDPMQELGQIAFALSNQFEQFENLLFSTQSPVDEQIVAERTGAVKSLIDQIVYSADGAQQTYTLMGLSVTPDGVESDPSSLPVLW